MAKPNKIFISHRCYDYERAVRLKKALLDNDFCNEVVLWENESLCRNYEQLTVHEYYEAIEKIGNDIKNCNAFLFIDDTDYYNGYFTSAEILQWRRYFKDPVIYPVYEKEGGFRIGEGKHLPPMDDNDQMRFSTVGNMMEFNPEYGCATESWGKYAHNCFLTGCCCCGKYYLITKKKMDLYTRSNELVTCPNCNEKHARFYQEKEGKKYFNNRYPIIMQPNVDEVAQLTNLDVEDIIELLNSNKLPPDIILDAVGDENYKSDLRKGLESTGKAVVGVGVVAVTLYFIDKLFGKN